MSIQPLPYFLRAAKGCKRTRTYTQMIGINPRTLKARRLAPRCLYCHGFYSELPLVLPVPSAYVVGWDVRMMRDLHGGPLLQSAYGRSGGTEELRHGVRGTMGSICRKNTRNRSGVTQRSALERELWRIKYRGGVGVVGLQGRVVAVRQVGYPFTRQVRNSFIHGSATPNSPKGTCSWRPRMETTVLSIAWKGRNRTSVGPRLCMLCPQQEGLGLGGIDRYLRASLFFCALGSTYSRWIEPINIG